MKTEMDIQVEIEYSMIVEIIGRCGKTVYQKLGAIETHIDIVNKIMGE